MSRQKQCLSVYSRSGAFRASQMIERIRGNIKPVARAATNPAATLKSAPSSPSASSLDSANDGPRELSSPPCYLNEFNHW